MYDDLLGPIEEKPTTTKDPKNKFNLKNKVCYDCGNVAEECDCEEGFTDEDLYDIDQIDYSCSPDECDCPEGQVCDTCQNENHDPWNNVDDDEGKDEDDSGCMGVGILKPNAPESSEPCDCEDCNCDECDDDEPGNIPPSQDIGYLTANFFNDQGRNCEDDCGTCEMNDCLDIKCTEQCHECNQPCMYACLVPEGR